MNATFVTDDGAFRKVWIRLTPDERREARLATLLSWIMPWKRPADLMSGELEAILCGHRPERYVTLETWPDKNSAQA